MKRKKESATLGTPSLAAAAATGAAEGALKSQARGAVGGRLRRQISSAPTSATYRSAYIAARLDSLEADNFGEESGIVVAALDEDATARTSRAKRAPGARAPKPRRRLADVLAMELAVLRGDAPPQASTRPGEVPLLSSLSTAGITWARASPAVMYIESGAFATPHAATAADGGSAAAAGVPPAPPHCAVCGFVGKYACVRCSAPFCTAGCLAAHKESGRCSTGLGSAASGAAAAAPFRGK